jgi:aspartyl-tRNA(Asn)/glutamyl-tRNA(Gln) amidotransferase subunit C
MIFNSAPLAIKAMGRVQETHRHFEIELFPMSIDQKTVAKIAHLARLKIPAEEQQQIAGELSKILNWIEQLNEVNVAGIEPLANVNDKALRWREDIVTDGGKPDDILANAPAKTADFFTVPKVVE